MIQWLISLQRIGDADKSSDTDNDARFLLGDYNSEDEGSSKRRAVSPVGSNGISKATYQLMERYV